MLQDFKFVGDVRGVGMMIGLDIVDNGLRKRHAPKAAIWIREALKARRVLVSTDGPFNSIIKLKPPLCFGKPEADRLIRELRPVRGSLCGVRYLLTQVDWAFFSMDNRKQFG